jgi:hypothetical protein
LYQASIEKLEEKPDFLLAASSLCPVCAARARAQMDDVNKVFVDGQYNTANNCVGEKKCGCFGFGP